MDEQDANFNCIRICASNFTISGNNSFCTTSGSYTIPGLPAGTTINWEAIPAGVVTINSPNALQTTLTRNNNGVIILRAVISNACGGQVAILKENVGVGAPTQPSPINVVLIDQQLGRIEVDVEDQPNTTSYNWYKNGSLQSLYHSNWAKIPIAKNTCDVDYGISVEAINSCGTSPVSARLVYVPCDGFYMLSPNPAGSTVTVSVDETKAKQSETKVSFTVDEVKIYDMQGYLKKQQRFNKLKSAIISIDNLQTGTYLVEIICGSHKEQKQLLVQK